MSVDYTNKPLFSSIALLGRQEINHQGSWGIVLDSTTRKLYVAQNLSGTVTCLSEDQKPQSILVPSRLSKEKPGSPTGLALNTRQNCFLLENKLPAIVLVATLDGTIAGYNPQNPIKSFVNKVQSENKKYTGVTLGWLGKQKCLFATDFQNGLIDVYDGTWTHKFSFTDPSLNIHGYHPFNINWIADSLYVCYAKHDETNNVVTNTGNGYINIFHPSGKLLQRLVNRGALNAPWGISEYADGILVSNHGDGKFLLYSIDGEYQAPLRNSEWEAVTVDGLFGVAVSNNYIYYAASIDNKQEGLVGAIYPKIRFKNPIKSQLEMGKGNLLENLSNWNVI